MNKRTAARQAGFTMVEMMIAMTLGLLLVVVIGQVFVTSKESYRTTEDLSRLQENARFAVTQLSRSIRMAGYMTNPLDTPAVVFPVATSQQAIVGTDGGGSVADQVTVRFQGSGAGTADGTVLDCQGNAIRAGEMAAARFYLAPGANGANALFCDNTGTVGPGIVAAQVELASDVENMQILYGEDTDLDGTANRYLPAGAGGVADFDNVVSVRIAVLARSQSEVSASLNTGTYDLIGTVFDPVDDRRLRRVYTATITLRNRAP
jgi:type IV pilus assembly protein PilW